MEFQTTREDTGFQKVKMNTTERRKNRNQIQEILCFSCFSPYLQEQFLKLWR
jgi:hypothetical protein